MHDLVHNAPTAVILLTIGNETPANDKERK